MQQWESWLRLVPSLAASFPQTSDPEPLSSPCFEQSWPGRWGELSCSVCSQLSRTRNGWDGGRDHDTKSSVCCSLGGWQGRGKKDLWPPCSPRLEVSRAGPCLLSDAPAGPLGPAMRGSIRTRVT